MINREDLHQRKSVRFHLNGYAYEILSIFCVYTIHKILICHVYVMYMLDIYRLKYYDVQTKIF